MQRCRDVCLTEQQEKERKEEEEKGKVIYLTVPSHYLSLSLTDTHERS